MTVDGIHKERWTTGGAFTMLLSSRLYVGGVDRSANLPGLRTSNEFVGCLRKVSRDVSHHISLFSSLISYLLSLLFLLFVSMFD